jgi:Uncharacterised nucleotidyltransferase
MMNRFMSFTRVRGAAHKGDVVEESVSTPAGRHPLRFHFNWKTLSVMAGITWWNFRFKLFPGAIKAPQIIEYDHAMHFVHPAGQDLDLPWNLTPFCLGPDADEDFWEASRETTFDGQVVRVLDPADQLLHICLHGAAWERLTPIRWIPDALVVLRKAPQLDWDRLLLQARKRKLTFMVRGALDYLDENIGHFVPAHVLSELRQSDVTVFERLEYRQLLKPAWALGQVRRKLWTFLRVSQGKTLHQLALSFPNYLCGGIDLTYLTPTGCSLRTSCPEPPRLWTCK